MKTETWVAVADLHGHVDHFRALLEHLDGTLGDDYFLCTLGDYVDNGDQIPELLDVLIDLKERRGDRFVPILGNHDLALLRVLGWPGEHPDELWYQNWKHYWDPRGETPRQYSLNGLPRSAATFAESLPSDHPHPAFLASLPWFHDTGDFVFVHAGMELGDLEPQKHALETKSLPAERLHLPPQMRDKALSCNADPSWDRVVVSAHNKHLGGPRFVGPNRICLSGEVDATGVLHSVVLPARRWLAVGRDLKVCVESAAAG